MQYVDRSVEHIPGAALRLDEHRFTRIGFDLAPQSQNLHVDRPIVDLGAVLRRDDSSSCSRESTRRGDAQKA